jgi:hypothetical protein
MFVIPDEILVKHSTTTKPETKIKKYMNTFKPADFFSINEIDISHRILKIPNYSQHFNPILKNSHVNLAEIDEELFERCDEINPTHHSNLIVKQLNIENNPTFLDIFYSKQREPTKKRLLNIINTYNHILKTIKILNTNQLINLDFHPSILVFRDNLPILSKLTKIFHLPTINQERKSNLFSNYHRKNVFLPPEAHLICYLNENDATSVSLANIEDICEDSLSRAASLNCFSKSFLEQYKESSRFSLQSFVNKSKDKIINDILKHSVTWNNYGISILFLVLLRDIFGKCCESPFISNFSQLLKQNIDPEPSNRLSIEKNISLFNDILYNTDKTVFLQLFNTLICEPFSSS